MNDQRPRLVTFVLLIILAFLFFVLATHVKGQVQSVGTTNDLALLSNPNTIHSNTLVTTEGTLPGDGTMAIWTWVKGKTSADFPGLSLLDSLTRPGDGIFVKNQLGGGAGTNIYNTIISTNITVVSNLYSQTTITTNLYITTNTYVINNGGTNQAGLWIETNSFLQPVHLDLPVRIDSNITWGPGTTNILYRSGNHLYYTNINSSGTFFKVSSDGSNYALFGIDGSVGKVTGANALYLEATPSSDYMVLQSNFVAPSPNGALSLGTTGNQWNSLYLTNQIVFGPGTTNVLYRSNRNLEYTNALTMFSMHASTNLTTDPGYFRIYGSDASHYVEFQLKDDGDVRIVPSSAIAFISASTITRTHVPELGDTYNLGSSPFPWKQLYMTNSATTNYIYFGTNTLSVTGTDLYWNQTKLN